MDFALFILALMWWNVVTYFWYVILIPFLIGCYVGWRNKTYKPLIWGMVISWLLSGVLAFIYMCAASWN